MLIKFLDNIQLENFWNCVLAKFAHGAEKKIELKHAKDV